MGCGSSAMATAPVSSVAATPKVSGRHQGKKREPTIPYAGSGRLNGEKHNGNPMLGRGGRGSAQQATLAVTNAITSHPTALNATSVAHHAVIDVHIELVDSPVLSSSTSSEGHQELLGNDTAFGSGARMPLFASSVAIKEEADLQTEGSIGHGGGGGNDKNREDNDDAQARFTTKIQSSDAHRRSVCCTGRTDVDIFDQKGQKNRRSVEERNLLVFTRRTCSSLMSDVESNSNDREHLNSSLHSFPMGSRSSSGVDACVVGGGVSGSGVCDRGRINDDDTAYLLCGDNALATFGYHPRECTYCGAPASYWCDQCPDFFLCEDCHVNDRLSNAHDPHHTISPLHENHCEGSRTMGDVTSLLSTPGNGAGSSLFYDPCCLCKRMIGDDEMVRRCEHCDFILCDHCLSQPVEHEHELKNFQRRSRNHSVRETTLTSKARTGDGSKIINEYVVVKLLGCGSHAKVKLVQHTRTRELYALKILKYQKKDKKRTSMLLSSSLSRCKPNGGYMEEDDLLREIAVMKFVCHPHIVELNEVIADAEAGKVYIIKAYCEGGPMYVPGDPPLPLTKVRRYGYGILRALLHLHRQFLFHRDVKPENCLVDGKGVVKLADFGTCNSRVRENLLSGSPAYSCPEQIIGNDAAGEVADSWAFALTLYHAAFGVLPFPTDNLYHIRNALTSGEPLSVPPPDAATMLLSPDALRQTQRRLSSGLITSVSAEESAASNEAFCDLMKKMLDKNIETRLLLSGAASHRFFDRVPSEGGGAEELPSVCSITSISYTSPMGGSLLCITTEDMRGSKRRGRDKGKEKENKEGRLSYNGNDKRSSCSSSSSGSTTSSPAEGLSDLYAKALSAVRHGRNLRECFHGVRAMRRVRQKEARHAEKCLTMSEHDSDFHFRPLTQQNANGDESSSNTNNNSLADEFDYVNDDDNDDVRRRRRGIPTPPHPPGAFDQYLIQSIEQQVPAEDSIADSAGIAAAVEKQLSTHSTTLSLVHLHMPQPPSALLIPVAATTMEIQMSYNALTTLAPLDFSLFSKVRDISITSNKLSEFPVEVLAAPCLLRLDLSCNRIRDIPPELCHVRLLERVNLHNNFITHVGTTHITTPRKNQQRGSNIPQQKALAPLSPQPQQREGGEEVREFAVSVLSAPTLRHVRLSGNPLEYLPELLDTTTCLELVLDAIPALMSEWGEVVGSRGHYTAPPAVVTWDDNFPVQLADMPTGITGDASVWIASDSVRLYPAHIPLACSARHVVLFQKSDQRFPKGYFTSGELGEYFDKLSVIMGNLLIQQQQQQQSPMVMSPIVGSGGSHSEERRDTHRFTSTTTAAATEESTTVAVDVQYSEARQSNQGAEMPGAVKRAAASALHSLPRVVRPMARGYVSSYFFISDDSDDVDGGYHRLHRYLVETLTARESVLCFLTRNGSDVKEAREYAIAALSEVLTTFRGTYPHGLQGQMESVMDAMKSLYA